MTALRVMRGSIYSLKCNRCGYEWQILAEAEPISCRRCKSKYWNKPRVRKLGKRGRPKKGASR